MGSFGERMRREREMRGITLDEIAESTKIGTRSLRALEQEDFDKLPGGIFNKGFVRAYARYLGIDEEQAVADYMAAFGDRDPQPLPIPPEAVEAELTPAPSHARRNVLVTVLVLAGLAAAGWQLYPRLKAAPAAEPARPPIEVRAAEPAAPREAPSALVPAAAGPPALAAAERGTPSDRAAAPAGDGFVVRINAREQSWISVSADDQPATEATLDPQTERTLRARSRLVVKIGNLRGVELSYNGQPVTPPPAGSNVATLTFTPEGVQR